MPHPLLCRGQAPSLLPEPKLEGIRRAAATPSPEAPLGTARPFSQQTPGEYCSLQPLVVLMSLAVCCCLSLGLLSVGVLALYCCLLVCSLSVAVRTVVLAVSHCACCLLLHKSTSLTLDCAAGPFSEPTPSVSPWRVKVREAGEYCSTVLKPLVVLAACRCPQCLSPSLQVSCCARCLSLCNSVVSSGFPYAHWISLCAVS